MDIKASIVIPCYKQGQYLAEAIESALSQSVKCEVIVVIDGMSQECLDVALKYPVKLVVQENAGVGAARNSGIRLARGEYILPLDADDRIDRTYVEKALSKFTEGVGIVGCGMETFGDYVTRVMPSDGLRASDLWPSNQICCCSMFPKKLWEEVGGYDEYINKLGGYEDWELWLRMLKNRKFALIPEYLFFYRKHGKSMVDEATANHEEIKAYIHEHTLLNGK